MSRSSGGWLRFLAEGTAETRPDATDPRLRGRTYAIPFEDVWQAALWLADGGLPGCSVLRANDRDGIIIAKAQRRFPRGTDDFTVSVILDADAQTRVDARSAVRGEGRDLGANTRRLVRFFQQLDRRVTENWQRRMGERVAGQPVEPHTTPSE